MNKTEIEKERNYFVAKRNDLIQKSRFSLTGSEQKILWHLISKIEPEDTDFKEYEFDINEFCRMCGIQESNGKNNKNLKKAIDSLKSKSFWIFLTPTYEIQIDWIEHAAIDHERDVLILKLNSLLKPYLLNLKDQKSGYSLLEKPVALVMQGKYPIRMYELLKSLEKLGEYIYEIEELKIKVDAEKYARFPDFRRRVLDPSVNAINKFADFRVEYELIKTGKANTHIKFIFKNKTGFQHYETIKLIEQTLAPKENQLAFV